MKKSTVFLVLTLYISIIVPHFQYVSANSPKKDSLLDILKNMEEDDDDIDNDDKQPIVNVNTLQVVESPASTRILKEPVQVTTRQSQIPIKAIKSSDIQNTPVNPPPSPPPHTGLFRKWASAASAFIPHVLKDSTTPGEGDSNSIIKKTAKEIGSIKHIITQDVGDDLKDHIAKLSGMSGVIAGLLTGNVSSAEKLFELGPLLQSTAHLIGEELVQRANSIVNKLDPIEVKPHLNLNTIGLGIVFEEITLKGFSNIQLGNVTLEGLTYYTLQMGIVFPEISLSTTYFRTTKDGFTRSGDMELIVVNPSMGIECNYSVKAALQKRFPKFTYKYNLGVPNVKVTGPLESSLITQAVEALLDELGGNMDQFEHVIDHLLRSLGAKIIKYWLGQTK